jgi:hypothetical protein
LGTTDGVAEVVDPDGNVVARDGDELTHVGGGASTRGDGWFSVCIINGRGYSRATDSLSHERLALGGRYAPKQAMRLTGTSVAV